jgi:IS1 family transposase
MNQISTETRVRVIAALIEGMGINATSRMTGVCKNTILKLLAQMGNACEAFHDAKVVNLQTKRVQCDEIWAFCHCKKMNTPAHLEGKIGVGDVWTWTAIDADSKLMIEWMIGQRDADCAQRFMKGLAPRLLNRVQITTDGLGVYKAAIGNSFDVDTNSDYAQCIKLYDDLGEGKYSPGRCTGVEIKPMWGNPEVKFISTSFVERHNLTIRMSNRRFTRLTNGHSKKIENHCHAIALNFVHYNFCRVHQTLKKTPAMAAGLTDHVWTIDELIGLMDSK